ncbi:hypothetical protein MWU75_08270 [Ornithinimicrobium sp. F0845]|uniref:hypothetical protein n=1 Tax=Ornithinimicrobium sp. F0845 TaxID=2926412 RepID=UPI001FF1B44F|nr:hypothetical protein [Ornithinimicrobium sp. F0845]MCK0112129.1 hypothetical protein [Ornithinimicrobium sp. F0845]
MKTATGRPAGRGLRRIPTRAVLAGLGVIGLLTVVAALLSWWQVVVVGLVILHLGTAVTVLGPWSRPSAPSKKPIAKMSHEIQDLERRVDALGARLVASTERTRVELLDAMADRTGGAEDRPS